jgi:hypothetical protein
MDKIQQIASSFKVFSKIIEKRAHILSNLQNPSPKNIPIFHKPHPPQTSPTSFFIVLGFAISILVVFVFRNNETVIWIKETINDSWSQLQQKTVAETFIRGNTVRYSNDEIRELLTV